MIWVSWRQHRGQAIACLAVLAGLAIYAIMVGSSMRTAFGNDALTGCLARSQGASCPGAVGAFMNEFGSEVNIAFWSAALIVPGLIGVLVGAPLIARELEYGTWRLAWSQTVPRTRWLAVKLALVTGGLIILGAAITAVITWYRAPMDQLTGHLQHNIYDFEGLVPTAYILCAFGFAVLAGLLLRRSIPAMIAAFIPWLTIRLVVEFVFRPHFMNPLTIQVTCPHERLQHRHQLRAAGHRPHRRLGAGHEPLWLHLPAGRPVLALPVHRGRHLRGPHRRRARRGHLAAAPARHLEHLIGDRLSVAYRVRVANFPVQLPILGRCLRSRCPPSTSTAGTRTSPPHRSSPRS